ncbi:hypothetical protein HRG_013929 [Hirsutella rhossiliensis]
MPREHPVKISPEEVRRTLGDLESQRSQQRRSYQRPSPLIRVPHDEILRVLHDMDRQRAEERSRHPKTLPYKTHAAASDCITETT